MSLPARIKAFFKRNFVTVCIAVMLFIGFALLFYPDFSSWWNGRIQREMVQRYYEQVSALSQEYIDDHFRRAQEHNDALSAQDGNAPLLLSHQAVLPPDYFEILNVTGGSVLNMDRATMARIQIPVINVNLPIFHSTRYHVLNWGVGHLEGTAFPIGGYNSHSVLTAHSGLANARMFNDLESLEEGDIFFISILGERLAYEVDFITIISPHQIEHLRIIPGEDLLTLITCYPYAVNSHRLLVRGRRVPYTPELVAEIEAIETAELRTTRMDTRVMIFVAFFVLFILTFMGYQIYIGVRDKNKRAEIPVPMPATRPNYVAPARADSYNYNYDYDYNRPANQAQYDYPGTDDYGYYDKYQNSCDPYEPEPRYEPDVKQPLYTYSSAYNPRARYESMPVQKGRVSRKFPMNKNLAAGLIAAVIIAGISITIAQILSQPQSSDTLESFTARIEEYANDYRERWMEEQVAQWLISGEITSSGEMYDGEPILRLRQQIIEYNKRIYETGQGNLPDPFAYTQDNFSLSYFGFNENMIGFITIPSIDIELPIYMGASRENLRRGLTHLTQTSLPVGGVNTNAVIAGHMNQGRDNFLSDISKIVIGDEIRITNFHETLVYYVIDIVNASYHPSDALKIRSGEDLITLMGYNGNSGRVIVVAMRHD